LLPLFCLRDNKQAAPHSNKDECEAHEQRKFGKVVVHSQTCPQTWREKVGKFRNHIEEKAEHEYFPGFRFFCGHRLTLSPNPNNQRDNKRAQHEKKYCSMKYDVEKRGWCRGGNHRFDGLVKEGFDANKLLKI